MLVCPCPHLAYHYRHFHQVPPDSVDITHIYPRSLRGFADPQLASALQMDLHSTLAPITTSLPTCATLAHGTHGDRLRFLNFGDHPELHNHDHSADPRGLAERVLALHGTHHADIGCVLLPILHNLA